jgi:hypothetical protein
MEPHRSVLTSLLIFRLKPEATDEFLWLPPFRRKIFPRVTVISVVNREVVVIRVRSRR